MSTKRIHVLFDDDDTLINAVNEIVKNKCIYMRFIHHFQFMVLTKQ